MVKKILLLDYGGVLGYDHLLEQEELLANTVGLTQAELNNRISEKSVVGRDFRENKITEVEFWRIVSQNSTIDEHSANILTGMWMDTYSLNNSMMKYLQKLRQNIQIGILTNIDAGRSRLLEKILDIDTNLDYYFPSYVFGFSKDTAQLWDLVNRELATVNGSVNVIYVDDRAEHVLSAARIGWKGKLRIEFGERSYIRDNDSEKLEDRLGDILVTLYEKAEENRIVREAREEAERKRVEEARCREENRQRKEQEIRLVKELVNKAEDYRIAKEIREYIQAMIDSGNEDITPEWIEWALKKADWYDPSIETEDEYLGKRQHEKSAEEKEKSLQDSIRKSWYW